jgi:hypothetical protein
MFVAAAAFCAGNSPCDLRETGAFLLSAEDTHFPLVFGSLLVDRRDGIGLLFPLQN